VIPRRGGGPGGGRAQDNLTHQCGRGFTFGEKQALGGGQQLPGASSADPFRRPASLVVMRPRTSNKAGQTVAMSSRVRWQSRTFNYKNRRGGVAELWRAPSMARTWLILGPDNSRPNEAAGELRPHRRRQTVQIQENASKYSRTNTRVPGLPWQSDKDFYRMGLRRRGNRWTSQGCNFNWSIRPLLPSGGTCRPAKWLGMRGRGNYRWVPHRGTFGLGGRGGHKAPGAASRGWRVRSYFRRVVGATAGRGSTGYNATMSDHGSARCGYGWEVVRGARPGYGAGAVRGCPNRRGLPGPKRHGDDRAGFAG